MPHLLTTASTLMCPHGGTVTAISSNVRANAGSAAIVRSSDTFLVAGCPFVIGTTPHPCLTVEWSSPAAKVKAAGDNALTEASTGLCKAADGAVQGSALVVVTQPRVEGT